MFHRKFTNICHRELDDVENLDMVSGELFAKAIGEARDATIVARTSFDLPVGVEIVEGSVAALFDGSRIKKWRAWFQTEDGQEFKKNLRRIVMAIILGLISGT